MPPWTSPRRWTSADAAREFGARARRVPRRSRRVAARGRWPRTASTIVPGAAELGDFDPTSTTIAFAPGGRAQRCCRRRRSPRRSSATGASSSSAATAAGTGTTTRRTSCASSARSSGSAGASAPTSCSTSSWPGAVRRRGTSGPRSSAAIARQPRFVGDMPHGWVASDFIRAVLDLFAYERDGDDALVIARRRSRPPGSRAPASRSRACARSTARSATRCGATAASASPCASTAVCACPRAESSLVWPGAERARRPARQRQAGALGRQRASHPRASCHDRHRRALTRVFATGDMSKSIEFPAGFLWGTATSALSDRRLAARRRRRSQHLAALLAHAEPRARRRHRRRRLRSLPALRRGRRADAHRSARTPIASASRGRASCRTDAARSTRPASTSTTGWSTRCSRTASQPMADAVPLGPAGGAR